MTLPIHIQPSPTADTRTCDVTQVTKEMLLESSESHIRDVTVGMAFFQHYLFSAAVVHDHDKLTKIDQFYADFQTKFEQTTWWDAHRKMHRHHLAQADGVPADLNLLDVLEYITDCVMAGMARSGKVTNIELSDELLRKAYENTIALLESQVVVDG